MSEQGKVETRLTAARTRLILDNPFLGALVLRLPMQQADPRWCPTTATDARKFFYNPEYIESLSLDETQFMLAHEALHCALSHFARRQHRDNQRWDLACDLAINPLLVDAGLTPPPAALVLAQFRDRTAAEIYPRLSEVGDRSGRRGRGGAGFPTARKWRQVRAARGERKYLICNGDEGDPGAFMDRMILESLPFRVIEGMALAAYAVGAEEGFFFIRAEYPLALDRVRRALAACEERGLLGDDVMGSGMKLRLTVEEGAGGFICGEETAMMESIEGRRAIPRLRPPYPAQQGLWGCPTLVNNVETFATVPWIVRHGPERYAALGTATSRGTKVFALAGKIRRGGLIEVPMGITIRQIVEEIGGGIEGGRAFKAVQIGGPSGGCVPAELADTPIDYESLAEVGAIMGSGGLVVLDETDCMVDVARYFLRFTQTESCGQCTFCRIGTRRMLDILDRICTGRGAPRDLQELERLAGQVQQGSICGLGRTAPNPVLSTIRYFRDEYEAHLEGRCPAGKCKDLITYSVTEECNGCTLCAQNCPYDAIELKPYRVHHIDVDRCERCDICRVVCPIDAIEVN